MADLVMADLSSFGVRYEASSEREEAAQPTAHIVSSKATSSRTIVLHNVMPELSIEAIQNLDLGGPEAWNPEPQP